MQFLATLLTNLAYLSPLSLAGWMAFLCFLVLLVVALLSWRKYHPEWTARSWGILMALMIATPIAALFLGLEFPTGSALPIPGLPEEPPGSTMMIFSACRGLWRGASWVHLRLRESAC